MAKKRDIDQEWTSEDIDNPVYSKQSHRAVDQKKRDERFKAELKDEQNARFDDVVVPAVETAIDFTPIVGDIKSAGEALLYTKEGNYAMASLAAMGVFPGIPGMGTLKRIFSKPGKRVIQELHGAGVKLEDFVDTAMSPKRVQNMVEWVKSEGGLSQNRKLSEMFPVLPWDMRKADKVSAKAVEEGADFVGDYYKHPATKARVQKIVEDNGYNMPSERYDILKEKGIIDENGVVDTEKYINLNPHQFGDTSILNYKDIEGYHKNIEDGGETVTFDSNLFYRRQPRRVAATAAHEENHLMQEVFGIDNMQVYDPDLGYYRANTDHTIGKMFEEVSNKNPKDSWYRSPAELHSVVMEYKKVKGIPPDKPVDDDLMDKMLEIGMLNHFFEVNEKNKPKIKKLLNALPAAIPVAAASGAMASMEPESYGDGGETGDTSNYDIAFDYLTNERNLSPEQAVAIMANLRGESNMNPDVTNSIGAYGIQQWLGPRKEQLFKKYGEKPTLKQQLEFLVDEHEGKIKGTGWNYTTKGKNMGSDRFNYYMYSRSDFDNAPSVADAIIAWNQGFGRPATHELNNDFRLKSGMELAAKYGVKFGDSTYGQMGLADPNNSEWKMTLEPESFRNAVAEKDEGPTPPLSNGVASYVPSTKESASNVIVEDDEEDEEETAYAKKLKERAKQIADKKKADQAKLDFFNKVWNGISLRRKNNE